MNHAYPHLRKFEGIASTALTHWQNMPLNGAYIVENILENSPSTGTQSVMLCSGGFDPHRGSYSEKTIRGILANPNISKVYEAHFFYQQKPGQLDPATYTADLSLIYQTKNAPIMIGMSASSWLLCAAMFDASQVTEKTDSPKTLLIGAIAPDHMSLMGRMLQPYYQRKSMQAKIAHHCGHSFTTQNGNAIFSWWDTRPPLSSAIKKNQGQLIAPNFGTQMDLLFFNIDTCSSKGRKLFKTFFGANTAAQKIPKQHRSLLDIPEVDRFLAQYCAAA